MKFVCGECKTKYTISDEKVRGKVLKVKCKKCEAVVEVREAAPGVEALAPVVGGPDTEAPAAIPAPAEPRARIASKPPPPEPRPRVATAPPGGQRGSSQPPGPRRPGTVPPPPPPEALAHRTARPATGAPRPGTPGPAAPSPQPSVSSSGVRPAVRPASFVARSGAPAGLAGSLAEALTAAVGPDAATDEQPLAEQGTIVTPHNLLADLGLARSQEPEWFIAIRDQPVGPMTRDDVQARINAGDVAAASLCWREGMDDWRPLREVHELGELLRGTGRAQLPATPPGRTPLRHSIEPTPLPIAPGRSVGSVATPIAAKAGSPLFPEVSGKLPTTGSSGSLQIPIEDLAPQIVPAMAAGLGVGPPPPPAATDYASIVPASRARKQVSSPLVWLGIFSAVAFGITLGLGLLAYVGPKLNDPPRQGPERVRVVRVPGDVAPPDLPLAPQGPAVPGEPVAVAPDQGPAPGRNPRPGTIKAPPGKALSAADAELLKRFQQQGAAGDRPISVDALHKSTGNAGAGGSSLTADQIRSVVRREKRSVQQCYERAMRGVSQARDLRVTLTGSVGPSGTVMSVRAQGINDAGMLSCIEGAVRRWRFPAAGGPSFLEIPVVFTAADR